MGIRKPERAAAAIPTAEINIRVVVVERIKNGPMRRPILRRLDAQIVVIQSMILGQNFDLGRAVEVFRFDRTDMRYW